MSKSDILFYIFVLFSIFVCIHVYRTSSSLKCVISSVDGNKYCVRERNKLNLAADILAQVSRNCKTLVTFLNEKYPDKKEVKRLSDRFSETELQETLPTSEFTAYSENKGEKIAFCLNKRKNESKLIDLNTITFVALHELSHIMTVQEGHPLIFWENFKFLLENAIEIGIYKPVDYKNNPVHYCGMDLTDNPYYDLK
tara:strand:- start:170 stop:760 length:591 start_codon:yes stop_codon:yes gene_type:complete